MRTRPLIAIVFLSILATSCSFLTHSYVKKDEALEASAPKKINVKFNCGANAITVWIANFNTQEEQVRPSELVTLPPEAGSSSKLTYHYFIARHHSIKFQTETSSITPSGKETIKLNYGDILKIYYQRFSNTSEKEPTYLLGDVFQPKTWVSCSYPAPL